MIVLVAGCGRWGYDEPAVSGDDAGAVDAQQVTGDGGRSDGATPDGPVGPIDDEPGCGSLQLLVEPFDGNATRRYWYGIVRGGDVRLRTERIEMSVPSGAPSSVAWVPRLAFDLRNSEIAVEVEPSGAGGAMLEVREGTLGTNTRPVGSYRGVGLVVERGELKALVLDGAAETVVATTGYDAARHRHWRLRERGGRIAWETSADRAAWATFHEAGVALAPASVFPILSMRGDGAARGDAWFDSVNAAGADVPGPCPVGSLVDDFADGALAVHWQPWIGNGCTVTETGGTAELRFPGEPTICTLFDLHLRDVRGGEVSLELPTVPTGPSFLTSVQLAASVLGDRVEIRIDDGSLTLSIAVRGTSQYTFNTPYDAGAHRFWRIREAAGQIAWDASPDGATWDTVAASESFIDTSALHLTVTGVDQASGGGVQLLRVDNVNRR
jgi:hypothetical protein